MSLRIPIGAPPPIGSPGADSPPRIDEGEFQAAHYVWMRRDLTAREIMRLGRSLIEGAYQRGVAALQSVFVRKTADNALALVGGRQKMPALYGETAARYRSRLSKPFTWHSNVGRVGGMLKAALAIEQSFTGLYEARFAEALWGVCQLVQSSCFLPAGAPALLWLTARTDTNGTEHIVLREWTQWIAADLAQIATQGQPTSEAFFSSPVVLSGLLPASSLALVTDLDETGAEVVAGAIVELSLLVMD